MVGLHGRSKGSMCSLFLISMVVGVKAIGQDTHRLGSLSDEAPFVNTVDRIV